MESAALVVLVLRLGLAASMDVLFGWQPMPDGSEKVEYIVQIEPELAATLKDGQSIPIISDIPDDIGPIGRIRIVVGRDDLPRQNVVTSFKPWPKQAKGEGVVETQFTVPPVQSNGAERYGNRTASNNQILPPGDNGSAAANPFGRALQQGAQQARDLAAGTQQQILPPTGNQLFGESGVNGQGVRNAIDNTADRLQRGLQQGLQRGVEQVADRTGQQLRQAVDNAGRNVNDAIDNFGRSPSSERSIVNNGGTASAGTILPPDASAGTQSGKGRRIDQPIQPIQPRRQPTQRSVPPAAFAESSGGSNPTSQPGVFDAPWPQTNNNRPAETRVSNNQGGRYGNSASQTPGANPQWPAGQQPRDAFDLANRTADNQTPRYGNVRQPELNTASNGMDGPQFPTMGNQQTLPQNTDSNWTNRPSATPEIRRDMLDTPIGADLQTASTAPGAQQQTAARQPLDTQPVQTQPGDFGWNQNNPNVAYNSANSSGSNSLFPLLLSWVLLSGSGAGNLYLFWSYLDVRSKYQGIVHGAPSRRERYDD